MSFSSVFPMGGLGGLNTFGGKGRKKSRCTRGRKFCLSWLYGWAVQWNRAAKAPPTFLKKPRDGGRFADAVRSPSDLGDWFVGGGSGSHNTCVAPPRESMGRALTSSTGAGGEPFA